MSIELIRDAIELSCEVVEYKSCFVPFSKRFVSYHSLQLLLLLQLNSMTQPGSTGSKLKYTVSPEIASLIDRVKQGSKILDEAHVRPLSSNHWYCAEDACLSMLVRIATPNRRARRSEIDHRRPRIDCTTFATASPRHSDSIQYQAH